MCVKAMGQFIVSSPITVQGERSEVCALYSSSTATQVWKCVHFTLQAQLHMCGSIQPTARQNLTDSSVNVNQCKLPVKVN